MSPASEKTRKKELWLQEKNSHSAFAPPSPKIRERSRSRARTVSFAPLSASARLPLPSMPPELGHSPEFEELSVEDAEYPKRRESSEGWQPVTDWKELFAHGVSGEPSSRMTARAIMWRIVSELKLELRQILYRLRRDSRGFHVELAVVSDGSLRRSRATKGVFEYDFGQEEAKHAGHGTLSQPWVETAASVSANGKFNIVHINYLSRDMQERSNVVSFRHPESVATRLLMCFALALGAHLLKRVGSDLQKSRVTLSAADKGSGKLVKYYSDNYGMGVVEGQSHAEDSHRMEGPLLQALQLCGAVWGMPAVQERSHEHLV